MNQPDDRRLPVVVPSRRQERAQGSRKGAGAFTAHIFGQTERRRGLRGGRYAIDQAHSAYLGVEWSGRADRRRATGGLIEGGA